MRSGLLAIMHKELRRFFTDRRMVISTVILPGLLIFLIYSFMGSAMTSNLMVDSDYEPQIYALNMPQSFKAACEEAGLPYELVDSSEVDDLKERIEAKELDLLIVFPEDFDSAISSHLSLEASGAPSNALSNADDASGVSSDAAAPLGSSSDASQDTPEVELYYNSTRVESSSAFSQMFTLLEAYKNAIQPVFSINTGDQSYDLASEEDSTGFMFASLLPMLLMLFLYSGCIAVAPESIAGEKERGTIATLLVTPLKRWELALGKILSLCIIALLAGASSFVGVMLSLPSLLGMTGTSDSGAEGIFALLESTSLYSAQDLILLFAIIISTVVLFVGLISIISAFARTVKEANTMVMPLMIIVMLIGATAMFQTSSETNLVLYLIPVYNSVQSMVGIFGFSSSLVAVLITVGVNVLISALCVFVLTRMFESERVVFSR